MKMTTSIILAMVLFLSACASEKELTVPHKTKPGQTVTKTFRPYGLFDAADLKDERVEYSVVVGNVVWTIILCETIIAPISFIGWYLYEPVGVAEPKE